MVDNQNSVQPQGSIEDLMSEVENQVANAMRPLPEHIQILINYFENEVKGHPNGRISAVWGILKGLETELLGGNSSIDGRPALRAGWLVETKHLIEVLIQKQEEQAERERLLLEQNAQLIAQQTLLNENIAKLLVALTQSTGVQAHSQTTQNNPLVQAISDLFNGGIIVPSINVTPASPETTEEGNESLPRRIQPNVEVEFNVAQFKVRPRQ